MNIELNSLVIIQGALATLMMIGILSLLYWLIENPILQDDEMRRVLENTRSIKDNAHRKSSKFARQESERLYH